MPSNLAACAILPPSWAIAAVIFAFSKLAVIQPKIHVDTTYAVCKFKIIFEMTIATGFQSATRTTCFKFTDITGPQMESHRFLCELSTALRFCRFVIVMP